MKESEVFSGRSTYNRIFAGQGLIIDKGEPTQSREPDPETEIGSEGCERRVPGPQRLVEGVLPRPPRGVRSGGWVGAGRGGPARGGRG